MSTTTGPTTLSASLRSDASVDEFNEISRYFNSIVESDPYCKYRSRLRIGRGAYGDVWTLQTNDGNKTIVVGKLADLSKMSEESQKLSKREAQNIKQLDHPNILKLYETYESDEKLLHILEYADAGDLLTQIKKRLSRSETPIYCSGEEILMILCQLCLAIDFMHNHRIMHRDLKTSNVMLMKSGLIKIGDFGFSRRYEETVNDNMGRTFCGTPYYLAPELWQQRPYGFKADIWSLGVICYELMTLNKPFPGSDLNDLMTRVCRQGSYVPLPRDRYSEALINLVDSMLRVDPAERPGIKDILRNPIIRDTGLELLKGKIKLVRSIDSIIASRLIEEADKAQQESRDN